jgi:glutathionyl-hydroquinone reductase
MDLSTRFVIPEIDSSQIPTWGTEVLENITSTTEQESKRLAEIILWMLGSDEISANRIKERFRMGNQAYDIVDTLSKMELVSKNNAKQPRKVIPSEYEDLPKGVITLLENNNYTTEQIQKVFSIRKGNKLV